MNGRSREVAPAEEKRIDPVNELRRREELPEHARVSGSIRYADVASRAQRGEHLLDARLDDALAKPEPPPRNARARRRT